MLYAAFTGEHDDFAEVAYEAKRQIVDEVLGSRGQPPDRLPRRGRARPPPPARLQPQPDARRRCAS